MIKKINHKYQKIFMIIQWNGKIMLIRKNFKSNIEMRWVSHKNHNSKYKNCLKIISLQLKVGKSMHNNILKKEKINNKMSHNFNLPLMKNLDY